MFRKLSKIIVLAALLSGGCAGTTSKYIVYDFVD